MNRASLLIRSIVAVLLLIGFYVLALGIAGGLLWSVYAQIVAGHVLIKVAFISVMLACVILWSVLPRPDRFEPPGPVMKASEHPKLFAAIREVAHKTGQAMPRDVYLVADVNAFVAQRGGIMGFFSHRVMGLGLPLLSLLSVAELRAVLAHEFGHYYGGDTQLGPWIYKTRSAMGRTIVSLAHSGSTIVRKPFEWYGNFFLKVTHSISRAQELSADALAARVAGAQHLVSGLKAVHGGAAAFGAFVQTEYGPVLEAGFRPPLAHGFRAFLDGKQIKASLEKLVAENLQDTDHDAFDTHPPLAQRIAALEAVQQAQHARTQQHGVFQADDTPAIELLGESDELEAQLVQRRDGKPLERLTWTNVAERVLMPQWQRSASSVAAELDTPTLGELVRPPAKLAKLAARILKRDLSNEPEYAARIGAGLCAAAVTWTLANAGWTVKNRIGRAITLKNGDLRLSPFKDFGALAEGKLREAELVKRLEEAGVEDVDVKAGRATS